MTTSADVVRAGTEDQRPRITRGLIVLLVAQVLAWVAIGYGVWTLGLWEGLT